MAEELQVKVVLKQTGLNGSNYPELLQRVATVYISGREYRVSAPPEAKGEALDWVPHFSVRQLVEFNSEIEIHDAFGVLALRTPNKTTSRRAVLCSFTSRGERCATRIDTVVNEIIVKNRPSVPLEDRLVPSGRAVSGSGRLDLLSLHPICSEEIPAD